MPEISIKAYIFDPFQPHQLIARMDPDRGRSIPEILNYLPDGGVIKPFISDALWSSVLSCVDEFSFCHAVVYLIPTSIENQRGWVPTIYYYKPFISDAIWTSGLLYGDEFSFCHAVVCFEL